MELSSFHQPIFFQMVCDLLSYRYLRDLADGSSPERCLSNFLNAPQICYCFSAHAGQDFHHLGATGISVAANKKPCSVLVANGGVTCQS